MAGIRIGQYGVKHGHATGKALALLTNPEVEFAGLFEPDADLRTRLAQSPPYTGARLLRAAEELLDDPGIVAVAIEGSNAESLTMAEQVVAAGKHLWYDKPGGHDWQRFARLIAAARERGLLVQMGYMFRYHQGFCQIAEWAQGGLLGDIFSVRAHMSTWLPLQSAGWTATARQDVAAQQGGIFYDLAGHMLDQIVWLLGRPQRVSAFLRNDAGSELPALCDNTLGVFEFPHALAAVDIAAMECRPAARRFEVYGSRGSAIMEPFEPAPRLQVTLEAPAGGYMAGAQAVPLAEQPRQTLYHRELVAFLATLRGQQPPDRSFDHELLVQETLLQATDGGLPGA